MADKYLIITPCIEGSSEIPASLLQSTDHIICADGGYEMALQQIGRASCRERVSSPV